jgi:hypothetical protein
MRKAPLFGLGALGIVTVIAGACSVQHADDDPKHGAANGLANKTPPDNGGTTSGPTPEGGPGPGGDAGGTSGCTKPDGGACAVSFKNDLFQKYIAQPGPAGWGCNKTTGNCHGAGANPPIMTDAPTAYANFLKQAMPKPHDNLMLINPNCIEANQSGFLCDMNTSGVPPCGDLMPLDELNPPAQSLTDLKTWIACGAPNN